MAPVIEMKENEIQQFKEYTLQLRHEIGSRLAQKMFTEEGPSPVMRLWTMYNKKKFMSLKYE